MDPVSPDEYDEHLTDAESGDDQLETKQEDGTSPLSYATGKPNIKPSSHLQKRRRVTRACDECRRKKIKCDGKQPCTHCTVYSYGAYDVVELLIGNPADQVCRRLYVRSAI